MLPSLRDLTQQHSGEGILTFDCTTASFVEVHGSAPHQSFLRASAKYARAFASPLNAAEFLCSFSGKYLYYLPEEMQI